MNKTGEIQTTVLERFEKVEIRGLELRDGKAVIQSVDEEPRWTGAKLTVCDRRKSRDGEIAIVTIRDNVVVLESWPNQEDEPDFVLDVMSFTSNTKNVVVRPDWSRVAWRWDSVSGHANISHHTNIFVIKFDEDVSYKNTLGPRNFRSKTEPSKSVGTTREFSYPRIKFEGFEAHCLEFLRTRSKWLRPDSQRGEFAWVGFLSGFSDPMRLQVIPGGKSGKILYSVDRESFNQREIYEYEFKRLSHFVQLLCNRVGKGRVKSEETIEKICKVSVVEKDGGMESFSPEDRLLLSKERELRAAGYEIETSTTKYDFYSVVYRCLVKGDKTFSAKIIPIAYGFLLDMSFDREGIFTKAFEILSAGKELVSNLA